MNSSLEKAGARSLPFLLLRALLSTVVIGAVALAALCWRFGRFQWGEVKFLIAQHWTFLVLVFLGIGIWDVWWEKTKQR